jgi:hypothetical protein
MSWVAGFEADGNASRRLQLTLFERLVAGDAVGGAD